MLVSNKTSKVICGVIMALCVIVLVIIANTQWIGRYTKYAIVKANYNGWIVAQDSDGRYYRFDDKEHTFEIGETVEIKLYDNGTEKDYKDDKIEKVSRLK